MKKTALLLTICLLFATLVIPTYADESQIIKEWTERDTTEWNDEWVAGENYTDGILILDSLTDLEISQYPTDEKFDFYGVSANCIAYYDYDLEYTEKEVLEHFGYIIYTLTLDSSVSVKQAYETLRANEEFSKNVHAMPDLAFIIPPSTDNSDDIDSDKTESAPKSDALPERIVWNDEWVAGYNYEIDEIFIYTDYVLDISEYDFDDFYGMKITRIFHIGSFLYTEQEELEKYGYITYGIMFDSAETDAKKLFFALNNEYNIVPSPCFIERLDEDEAIPNDVNSDGVVDMFDYIYVKNVYFKLNTATDIEKSNADVNGDGSVNMFDYIQVKNAYFA